MPTPRGNYYKQLGELFSHRSKNPNIGGGRNLSSCISLVAQRDFLSILPEELGADRLIAHRLVMIPIAEPLPKAAYYLIQRRDSQPSPLTASLITQFRRQSQQLFQA